MSEAQPRGGGNLVSHEKTTELKKRAVNGEHNYLCLYFFFDLISTIY